MLRRPWKCIVVILPLAIMLFGQKSPDVSEAPPHLTSHERIAPVGERGTPLVIDGTVVAADGKPLAGVIVYAYHTDADGYYRRTDSGNEAGEEVPRLRGWVRTDAFGHFQFISIQPAPYPHRNVPAHIHIHAWGAGYPRQWFMLEFAGDPLLPKQHFSDNTANYLYVMTIRHELGVVHATVTLRMRHDSNFTTP